MTGFFTTQEAAQRLKVTDARVRQMVADGVLTGQRVGNAIIVIPAADVSKLRRERLAKKRRNKRK